LQPRPRRTRQGSPLCWRAQCGPPRCGKPCAGPTSNAPPGAGRVGVIAESRARCEQLRHSEDHQPRALRHLRDDHHGAGLRFRFRACELLQEDLRSCLASLVDVSPSLPPDSHKLRYKSPPRSLFLHKLCTNNSCLHAAAWIDLGHDSTTSRLDPTLQCHRHREAHHPAPGAVRRSPAPRLRQMAAGSPAWRKAPGPGCPALGSGGRQGSHRGPPVTRALDLLACIATIAALVVFGGGAAVALTAGL